MIWCSPTRHHTIWGKPGFIRKANTSPQCQMPLKASICPLELVTKTNCSQVKTPARTTSSHMSRSLMVCVETLVVKPTVASAGLIMQVKKQDVEVLDWRGDMWLRQLHAALTSSAQFECYIVFNEGATTATCLISHNVVSQIKEETV